MNKLNLQNSISARIYDGTLIITDNGVIFPQDNDDAPPPPLIYVPVDEDFDWSTIIPSINPPPEEEIPWNYVISSTEEENNIHDDWPSAKEVTTENWSEPTDQHTNSDFPPEIPNEEAILQA